MLWIFKRLLCIQVHQDINLNLKFLIILSGRTDACYLSTYSTLVKVISYVMELLCLETSYPEEMPVPRTHMSRFKAVPREKFWLHVFVLQSVARSLLVVTQYIVCFSMKQVITGSLLPTSLRFGMRALQNKKLPSETVPTSRMQRSTASAHRTRTHFRAVPV